MPVAIVYSSLDCPKHRLYLLALLYTGGVGNAPGWIDTQIKSPLVDILC